MRDVRGGIPHPLDDEPGFSKFVENVDVEMLRPPQAVKVCVKDGAPMNLAYFAGVYGMEDEQQWRKDRACSLRYSLPHWQKARERQCGRYILSNELLGVELPSDIVTTHPPDPLRATWAYFTLKEVCDRRIPSPTTLKAEEERLWSFVPTEPTRTPGTLQVAEIRPWENRVENETSDMPWLTNTGGAGVPSGAAGWRMVPKIGAEAVKAEVTTYTPLTDAKSGKVLRTPRTGAAKTPAVTKASVLPKSARAPQKSASVLPKSARAPQKSASVLPKSARVPKHKVRFPPRRVADNFEGGISASVSAADTSVDSDENEEAGHGQSWVNAIWGRTQDEDDKEESDDNSVTARSLRVEKVAAADSLANKHAEDIVTHKQCVVLTVYVQDAVNVPSGDPDVSRLGDPFVETRVITRKEVDFVELDMDGDAREEQASASLLSPVLANVVGKTPAVESSESPTWDHKVELYLRRKEIEVAGGLDNIFVQAVLFDAGMWNNIAVGQCVVPITEARQIDAKENVNDYELISIDNHDVFSTVLSLGLSWSVVDLTEMERARKEREAEKQRHGYFNKFLQLFDAEDEDVEDDEDDTKKQSVEKKKKKRRGSDDDSSSS